jgi:archaemetzincin
MSAQHITLLTFGFFDKNLLKEVAEAVALGFRCEVVCKEARIDLGEYFNAGRRQYNGDRLLSVVGTLHLPDSMKTIGLFSVDLYIPILTYIFGQAHLGGEAGVASMFRLGNELYGLAPELLLQNERFIKEVIHELGHTFGLLHCYDVSCVMRSSAYVEDIDQKEKYFCANCYAALGFIGAVAK